MRERTYGRRYRDYDKGGRKVTEDVTERVSVGKERDVKEHREQRGE